MRSRRWAFVFVAVVLTAAACGSDGDKLSGADRGGDATTPGQPAVEAVTIPIFIDGHPEDFSTSLLTYFPSAVTAHRGDTVQFTSRFGGEPHTVALGTMVEAVFAPVASGGEPSAEARAKLPQFFDASAPVLPLSEPLQAGAQPCFVASGPVPTTAACSAEQQAQPATFTGAQAIYSSGFLPDEAKFTVKLDEGIEPGVYHFMCLVHGADESGTITVVPTGTTIPTPAQVAAEAQAKFDTAVTALRPAAEQVQQSTSPRITVGAEVPGGPGLEFSQDVNVFPKEVTVAAGQAVTWTVNDAHTVSFNAPEDARPLYVTDADGVVRANRKGADPSNGPGQQPPQAGAAPTGPTVIDGGRFDGSGFRSSGLLVSLGAPVEYTLAFTKAGTYKYRCLFHLDMEGVVKVS